MTNDVATKNNSPKPRVRWGAIVWGTIVATSAILCLFVLGSIRRQSDVFSWLASLNPAQAIVIAVLCIGAVVLILGLLALLRRSEKLPAD